MVVVKCAVKHAAHVTERDIRNLYENMRISNEIPNQRVKNPNRKGSKDCKIKACRCDCHNPDMSEFAFRGDEEWPLTQIVRMADGEVITSNKRMRERIHEDWLKWQHESGCSIWRQ